MEEWTSNSILILSKSIELLAIVWYSFYIQLLEHGQVYNIYSVIFSKS